MFFICIPTSLLKNVSPAARASILVVFLCLIGFGFFLPRMLAHSRTTYETERHVITSRRPAVIHPKVAAGVRKGDLFGDAMGEEE